MSIFFNSIILFFSWAICFCCLRGFFYFLHFSLSYLLNHLFFSGGSSRHRSSVNADKFSTSCFLFLLLHPPFFLSLILRRQKLAASPISPAGDYSFKSGRNVRDLKCFDGRNFYFTPSLISGTKCFDTDFRPDLRGFGIQTKKRTLLELTMTRRRVCRNRNKLLYTTSFRLHIS